MFLKRDKAHALEVGMVGPKMGDRLLPFALRRTPAAEPRRC